VTRLVIPTLRTKSTNFDNGAVSDKPEPGCRPVNGPVDRYIIELRNPLTLRTDQKLSRVLLPGVGATGIGIHAFDTVYQALFEEKIEGPVNRRGGAVKTFGA